MIKPSTKKIKTSTEEFNMPSIKEKFQEAGAKFGFSVTQIGAVFEEATNLIVEGMKSLETQEWPGLGSLVAEHKPETERKIGGLPRIIPEKIEAKFRIDNKLKKILVEQVTELPESAKPGGEKSSPSTATPPIPVPRVQSKIWYFAIDGTSYGPMTIAKLVASPTFDIDKAQVFNEEWGTKSWQRACDVAAVMKEFEKQKDEKLPPIPMN